MTNIIVRATLDKVTKNTYRFAVPKKKGLAGGVLYMDKEALEELAGGPKAAKMTKEIKVKITIPE